MGRRRNCQCAAAIALQKKDGKGSVKVLEETLRQAYQAEDSELVQGARLALAGPPMPACPSEHTVICYLQRLSAMIRPSWRLRSKHGTTWSGSCVSPYG